MMRKFSRENGLSIAAIAMFATCIVGQAIAGRIVHNEDAVDHGARTLDLLRYLRSGDFIEAVFENWESEFLQMAVFVVLTRFLRQRGSSESKALDGEEEVDSDPRSSSHDPEAPWPVRQGGWVLRVYEHSLSIALLALFALSFGLHAYGGMLAHNEAASWHHTPTLTLLEYFVSAKFWQESFQNWQSEFLSVATLVLLSIVLRERGSPQSKPVAAPMSKTGG